MLAHEYASFVVSTHQPTSAQQFALFTWKCCFNPPHPHKIGCFRIMRMHYIQLVIIDVQRGVHTILPMQKMIPPLCLPAAYFCNHLKTLYYIIWHSCHKSYEKTVSLEAAREKIEAFNYLCFHFLSIIQERGHQLPPYLAHNCLHLCVGKCWKALSTTLMVLGKSGCQLPPSSSVKKCLKIETVNYLCLCF